MRTPLSDGMTDQRVKRTTMVAVAAAAFVLIGANGRWSRAVALQRTVAISGARHDSAAPASPQLRLAAPIGHRQPRPGDLPAGVLRDETSLPAGERAIDKDLRICRAC
jgi:hypothetical protein